MRLSVLVHVDVLDMDEHELSWKDVLFGEVALRVDSATCSTAATTVQARGIGREGCCPSCGTLSVRVHDRYRRRLQDVPLAARCVRIELEVRRFVCANSQCVQRTFAEQIPGFTSAYARCTDRLGALLNVIALALAGRAGSRMATALGIVAGRMGLLNRVRAMPDPSYATPRVLGVDDFAIKRGHTYATVLTCGDTHRVVDVLPTREAGPLTMWLLAHPGVEVICRDRAGAYAEGAAAGAPDAQQVADRYHLWANLGQAVEKCVAAHRTCLPSRSSTPNLPQTPQPPRPATSHGNGRLAARLQAHHALVHGLLEQGMGLRAIARHLGWGRHTVQRYARAEHWHQVSPGRHLRGSSLDVHHAYLSRRIAETRGRISLVALHRELAERGWHGSYSTLRDWAVQRLPQPRRTPQPPPAPPSIRQVTGWLTRRPSSLTEDEHQQLKAVLEHCSELTTAHQLVRDFGDMLTEQTGVLLPAWIGEAMAADLPGLTSFARGLTNDIDAVTAGLTLRWSSGITEGAVNRIKKIKRQLYGRAEFELLRKMILLA
ncbi:MULTISPECIES: ISL3 family transposase [Streptomyces]|uniref:Transposase n=1 Tax=Streptomyces dengpaensis TaxID=2049881 RepID=A0ABN5HZD0_9ACTN|nr:MULTISPECIES: ISL3 family transposase [Streptomyces]AVH54707.1 transposase [Streptomyces dengpaensis]